MTVKNYTAPPTAFELGKPSATGLLKYKPNLDVEAARAAMVAAGQQPGNERIKDANVARRVAFRDAQLAGLPPAEAKIASQTAYDAVINGELPPVVAAPVAAAPVVTPQTDTVRT